MVTGLVRLVHRYTFKLGTEASSDHLPIGVVMTHIDSRSKARHTFRGSYRRSEKDSGSGQGTRGPEDQRTRGPEEGVDKRGEVTHPGGKQPPTRKGDTSHVLQDTAEPEFAQVFG